MIKIEEKIIKKQENFWNACIFHPTDAVEDPWGRKILDRIAADKSIYTVRIYAMFEDIVYFDENDNLAYDFRLSDLRLDYLVEKGYNILIAYGMMPHCIASKKDSLSNVSKNKTRYKGKMLNTSIPTDYKLWEEICYAYTKHIVERYGLETVSKWYLHCYNEPDSRSFFMLDVPNEIWEGRVIEYCKLYQGFVDGVTMASEKLRIGGPALASRLDFLEGFLNYVKNNNVRLDYISLHNYSHISVNHMLNGEKFSVDRWILIMEQYLDVIHKCGFSDTEIVVDEWGMSAAGFYNVEECPPFIAREHEAFSAYYVRLIHEILRKKINISLLMICLSGQHEMVTDFSGFRNFFTLNFFAKPIYNAHILASKLYEGLLEYTCNDENIFVIPTKNEKDEHGILLSYCRDDLEETLPDKKVNIELPENLNGKAVTLYCIDKNTTNPYRVYEKMGSPSDLTKEQIKILREEGNIKPIKEFEADGEITLDLTSNSVYLITVKENV